MGPRVPPMSHDEEGTDISDQRSICQERIVRSNDRKSAATMTVPRTDAAHGASRSAQRVVRWHCPSPTSRLPKT
jgi:hypothetical protein